jgi:hypothetical protein
VAKVPEVQVRVASSYVAPCERGKNSYQEAKSASRRSTKIG